MFFTVGIPPVIDRTILFPYKCCVFLKVLGTAKLSLNELPSAGANGLSMISGYTPWWIFVHPKLLSSQFPVGYFPNLEVWIWFSKNRNLQKFCLFLKLKCSSFFSFFFHFFSVWELALPRRSWWNSQEMARLKRSLLMMLWRTRRRVWESQVGDCIPSVGRQMRLLSPDQHQIFLRNGDFGVGSVNQNDLQNLGEIGGWCLNKKYVQKNSQSKSWLSAGSPEKSVQLCELLELKDRFRRSMF